jgi:hypothetical protein
MFRKARLIWVPMMLAAILPCVAQVVQAQIPATEQLTVPPKAASEDPLPGLPRLPDEPRSLLQQPPPNLFGTTLTGPYFEHGNTRLDPPELPPPGCFVAVEIDPTVAHVKNDLSNSTIPTNMLGEIVRLPSARLDWTVSPRFEVGYRLPCGFGAVVLGYRFLATDGSGTIQGPDALESLKSRLDFNVADLDYASWEISLFPHVLEHTCDMQWRFGLRFASVFFDSQAVEPFAAAAAPGGSHVFERRNADSWSGVGPHVALDLGWRFGDSGWSLVGKTDFFLGLGRIHQTFVEVPTNPGAGGELRDDRSQAVPVLNVQAGLRWKPPVWPKSFIFAGYQYEYWWNVGRNSITVPPDLSNGSFWDQGFVLRAEINF